MSNEKIYVGRVETKENKFGDLETKIGLTAENLQVLTENLSERGWVNLTLKTTKEGKPYLQVDNWKPAGVFLFRSDTMRIENFVSSLIDGRGLDSQSFAAI